MPGRDTSKYEFKVGNKVVHVGITTDLCRRESEHQNRWPRGHIKKVGRNTTPAAALKWENEQRRKGKPTETPRRGE